ncbi:MAG: hypothetical protein M3Q71_02760 [Chloroflexota bacterium]|nr:hypothetical protein [Chloroflexota bacterium]
MPEKQQDKQQEKVPAIDVQAVPPAESEEQIALGQRSDEARGKVVKLAQTPEQIAKQGTKLGIAGDAATGGNVFPALVTDVTTLVDGSGGGPVVPAYGERLYATDRDVTVLYRNDSDPFTFDCVVSE